MMPAFGLTLASTRIATVHEDEGDGSEGGAEFLSPLLFGVWLKAVTGDYSLARPARAEASSAVLERLLQGMHGVMRVFFG